MLVLKVIATVFIAFSIITALFKNIDIFYDELEERIVNFKAFMFATVYGVLWRALVIVAIWLV